MKTVEISTDKIKIKRNRKIYKKDVSDLVESIREIGLINPITVSEDYELMAGWRRLQAIKNLKKEKITCIVLSLDELRTRLVEIDENIVRQQIPKLEAMDLLRERKPIYEKLHPETRRGVAQAAGMNKVLGRGNVAPESGVTSKSFAKDTAKKTGKAESTVFEEIQIAEKLTPKVKKIILAAEPPLGESWHPLANNKTKLKAIATLKPEAQVKKVKAELSGTSKTSALDEEYNEADEWYTPDWVISCAKQVMGAVDLDPASSLQANKKIKAKKYYTIKDNGLNLQWKGRIFLNPPFSKYNQFVDGLLEEIVQGNTTEAILLVNNSTETAWFQKLLKKNYLVCLPKSRLHFWHPDRASLTGRNGQAIFYIGLNENKFKEIFGHYGIVVRKV
jgi:ParB family chromosome partitioning protein